MYNPTVRSQKESSTRPNSLLNRSLLRRFALFPLVSGLLAVASTAWVCFRLCGNRLLSTELMFYQHRQYGQGLPHDMSAAFCRLHISVY